MDNPERAAAPRDRSADVTLSRTWELELFISGATVFALLQAPAVLDGWWARADAQLAGNANALAFFLYYYGKLILYTLIATFVVHLVSRGYWIALVGLHSIFPHGVRWEELNLGPSFIDAYRSRLPPLHAAIRRVDDLSSLLFSGGMVVMLIFALSVILVLVIGVVAGLVGSLLFGGEDVVMIGAMVVAAASAIPAIAKMLDDRRGPDAPPHPVYSRLAVFSYHFALTPVIGPLSMVMSSNLGRRRATFVGGAVLIAIVATFVVRDVMIANDALRVDSHDFMPDENAAQEMDPAFYEDRRDGDVVYDHVPMIQSEVVTGPYVRLFVPVSPDRHNDVIEERCPDVPRFGSGVRFTGRADPEPAGVDALLGCLLRLQPVSLDGQPVAGLEPRLSRTANGVRGFVLFIPARDLAPGEHTIRVDGLPRTRDRADRPARPPYLIRFYR